MLSGALGREDAIDDRSDVIDIKRFGDIFGAAGVKSRLDIFLGLTSGYHNDGDVFESRLGLGDSAEIKTINPRKVDVHND